MDYSHLILSPTEPGLLGVKVGDIESFNDGDVVLSLITKELVGDRTWPGTYVDIGVDQGWWTAFCLSLDPSGTFLAIEPNPASTAALQVRFQGTPVRIIPKAASATDGTIRLALEGASSHSRGNEGVEVETVNTAALLSHIPRITMMKIDTEGHEIVILRNLKPMWNRIDAVVLEYTVYWYSRSDALSILEDLLQEFPHLYILARRYDILLYGPITAENYQEYALTLLRLHIQVDILCCRRAITSIPVHPLIDD